MSDSIVCVYKRRGSVSCTHENVRIFWTPVSQSDLGRRTIVYSSQLAHCYMRWLEPSISESSLAPLPILLLFLANPST